MKKQHHMRNIFIVMAAMMMLALGAISDRASAAEEVTYRLKWLINMSTVGDVYADVQGYFKEEGLAVKIKPGGPERDAIRELEMGYSQFGVASADQIINALEKGSPVVVTAQLFQVNPLRWIYRRKKMEIRSLSDLKGKTLGVTFGKNDEFIMRALLSRAGINDNDVKLFSVRLDYTPFFRGDVDLWPVYINSQGVDLERRMAAEGDPIAFFNPADYGVRFVANSVVTSRKMMTEKPDTVRRFMHALLKGWRVSLEPANAQKAIEIVSRYDKDTSLPVMKAQLKTTRPLVKPDPGTVIGQIDKSAWKQTEELMLKYKQITKPVDVLSHIHAELE
jgi:NitT/TauT family transport system substrate-binding protein